MIPAQVLAALAEHADLIAELIEALARGANKDALQRAVKAAMVEASDRAMREELAARQP